MPEKKATKTGLEKAKVPKDEEACLIVAPHPDDEVLGCAAYIGMMVESSIDVFVMYLTNGVGSRVNSLKGTAEARRRNLDAHKAAKLLGYQIVYHGHEFQDNALDKVGVLTLAQCIETVIRDIRPVEVLIPSIHDLNVDHRMAAEATMVATRPVAGGTVKALHSYYVPSATEWSFGAMGGEFRPNVFLELDAARLAAKLEACAVFESEMRPYPHPRSLVGIETAARFYGMRVGQDAVEPFETIWESHTP